MVLLQSKEEILEAINADIVSNGKKGITGDILNLIFNSLVELIGKGSGGGGNVYNLPMGMMMATEDAPYTFSAEEAAAFKSAIQNIADTVFGLSFSDGDMAMKITFGIITPTPMGDGSGTTWTMIVAYPMSQSMTLPLMAQVVETETEVVGIFGM